MTLAPQPPDKLFFALLPDPDAGALIADLAKDLAWNFDLSGVPIPVDRLHISLKGVGRFDGLPPDVVTAAKAAGAAVQLAPFEVAFDQRLSFKGVPHPLVLTSSSKAPELLSLREALMGALGGDGTKAAAFVPHVTLLRDPKPLAPAPLDVPISWMVHEFVLIHSVKGKGHTHLARWQLRP